MATTFRNIGEELRDAQKSLAALLNSPKDSRGDDYEAKREFLVAEIKGLHDDFQAVQFADVPEDDKGSKAKLRAEVENAGNRKTAAHARDVKGLRELGQMLKSGAINAETEVPFDVKALMDSRLYKATTRTDMGLAVGYDELNIIPTRPVEILDFLPSFQTGEVALTYRRRTTPIAGAVNRAEGNSLGTVSATGAQITDPIQAIGSIFDVSLEEEQDDRSFQLILNAMADDVLEVLDGQVMIGNGTAPNLRGITTTASPQTQTYATSRLHTAKVASTSLRTTERARPTLYVFLPSDWDLIYGDVLTSPSFAVSFVQNGLAPRLHGYTVVEHEDMTSGVGAIMDPSLYAVGYRQGLVIERTNSDGVKFADLTTSYRAYVRAALKTLRLGVRLIDLVA